MRLKLDENLPHDFAAELTRWGHDVDTVSTSSFGGRKDPIVVQAATDDDRMVITLDRGVGNLHSSAVVVTARVVPCRPVLRRS